jgi:hypothetical protein
MRQLSEIVGELERVKRLVRNVAARGERVKLQLLLRS